MQAMGQNPFADIGGVNAVLIGNPQVTTIFKILSDYFEFELRTVFAHDSDPFELDWMSNFCGSVQCAAIFLSVRPF